MPFLTEVEAYKSLESQGIHPVPHAYASNTIDAVYAAREIGYPVVMKIVSEDIIHKSDAGCVIVGINNDAEAEKAFVTIMENAERVVNGGHHFGVLITKLIFGGVEVIIGAGNDPEFGRYLMFGLGGVFVELYKDVAFRMLPLCERDVDDMISEVKASRLLYGYRSTPKKDIDALRALLLRCSDFIAKESSIVEMDLNPVMVCEQGVYILDARIKTE